MYKAQDIQWICSHDEGVIPYIINNERNKAKTILDDMIFGFVPESKSNNHVLEAARTVIADYYGIEQDQIKHFTTEELVSKEINMFQWLFFLRGKTLWEENSTITKHEIVKLKKLYDNKSKREALNEERLLKRISDIEEKTDKEREF